MTKGFLAPSPFRWCKQAFYAVVLGLIVSLPAHSQTQFQTQLDKLRQAVKGKSAVNLFDMLRQKGGQQWSPERWGGRFGNFDRNALQKAAPKASGFDRAALLAKLKGQAALSKKNPAQIQALAPPAELEWATIFDVGGLLLNTSIAVDGDGNSYSVGFFDAGYFIVKYNGDGFEQWALPIFSQSLNEFAVFLAPPQVAADEVGNVYVTGVAIDETVFESADGNTVTLPVPGQPRMFLGKYDTNGNVLWVVSSSDDSGFNAATEVDVDASGNIYISGFFDTAVTLGPDQTAETILADDGEAGLDAFWAKYNAVGELQWARAASGPDVFFIGIPLETASDITVDASGNVYIVGYFEGELVFERDMPDETVLTTGGISPLEIFYAKYTANGEFVWAIAPGMPYFPGPLSANASFPLFWGPDIEAAKNGNVYISTFFADFDNFSGGTSIVFAIDTDGTILWENVNEPLGEFSVLIFDIDSDDNSNVYAHGSFSGDATFDVYGEPQALTSTNLNIFLEKIDSNGELKWIKTENVDNGALLGAGVAARKTGSVFVAATQFGADLFAGTPGTVIYGQGEPNETTIADAAGPVTIKYDAGEGKRYALLATESIELDKYKFVEGDLHSNGYIEYDNGRPGTHTGSASAVGKITVNRDNTITGPGDLTAGSTIKVDKKAKVHGTIAANASVDAVDLPTLSYSCSGANGSIIAGKDKKKDVAPGDYNILRADKNAQLNLSAGEYSVNSLVLNDRSRLHVDVSGGEVIINVCGDVNFIKNADIIIVGGTSEDLTINYIGTKTVVLGKDGGYQGNLIAPNAAVAQGSNAGFLGAICAKSIYLEKDARVRFHGLGAVPKSVGDDEEDDQQEITSSQQPVTSYELSQNYPNPFNPTTTISFALPEAGDVTLSIYNTNGQLVKKLVAGEMSPGRHNLVWDATDARGQRVASGVYLYVLRAGEFVAQRKLVLMK